MKNKLDTWNLPNKTHPPAVSSFVCLFRCACCIFVCKCVCDDLQIDTKDCCIGEAPGKSSRQSKPTWNSK